MNFIEAFVDCGQQEDGRHLSIFRLRNGKIVKSYFSGPMEPSLRMMEDAKNLYLGGVSLRDIELFGIPEVYLPRLNFMVTTA